MIRHHFTIDVEEYFHANAFDRYLPRGRWSTLETRVEASVDRLLAMLAAHEARATCFVLGWIAERHPQVVRAIAAAGHEVASHGQDHRRVTEQSSAEFRASVRCSKQTLEDLTGSAIHGFRAPSFSITPGREWALDVLVEEGYGYDSSLFPVRRQGYGYPQGRTTPHWLERPAGRLAEVPPTTLRRLGVNLPASGGAYFRHFPYGFIRTAIRECQAGGMPATFYIHPWELDLGQPRLDVPLLTRARHYGGLTRTERRLERLLREFRFGTIAETVARL